MEPRTQEHPLLGQTIGGRYQVTGLVGRGGMGEVLRARDQKTGGDVALKILLSHRESHDNRERFLREARAMSLLEHPNVVKVFGAGQTEDGAVYLAMELLEGEDLRKRMRRAPLSLQEVLHIGAQVCDALVMAHERGVVHRDLKPANLFLHGDPQNPQVKILDFGLARLTDEDLTLTQSGTVIGTPAYMAPEQARGDKVIDGRADLYALGATLYEAISGKLPFEAENRVALLLKVLREDPRPIRQFRPDIPPSLEALLLKALARKKEERFPNARAMREAILDCLQEKARSPEARGPIPDVPHTEERRLVAILYAEGVASEDIVLAAREEGGWAEHLLGERAVSLFGLEGSFGDEAARAVRAALKSAGSFSRACVATARVELSSGAPVLGPLLDAVFGLAAATLEGMITVDGETYRQVRGRFDAREEAEGLWAILRERPQALGIGTREVMGVSTPTVGREMEISQLRGVVERLLEERQPVAVTLVGPAGVGKSRLRYELALYLESRPERFFHLYGRAEPLRTSTPFGLFADVLRQRGQIPEGAPPEERRRLLTQIIARSAPDDEAAIARISHALGALLGIPFPQSKIQKAMEEDPEVRRITIEENIVAFLRGIARKYPPILFLEDLHFSDDASLSLLDQLLWRCHDTPLLVVALTRPELFERRPQLFSGWEHLRIEVRPLRRRAVERLIAAILGSAPPPELTDFLADRAGGIPFFVEELLWALRDRGLLTPTPDGWALLGDPNSADLPHGIEGVLQARLDQLPAAEKELLKRASVFGDSFWEEAVSDDGVDLAPLLRRLRSRELIVPRVPSRFSGTIEFFFRHALLRDVAYSLLPEAERRRLHKRAGEWLKKHSEQDATVAWHLEVGGDVEGAAAAYIRAGDLAQNAYAHPEALRCYARALALLPEDAPERFSLTLSRARIFRHLGQWREAKEEALLASQLADEAPDLAARAHSELAMAAQELQEHELCNSALSAALRYAEESQEPETLGDVLIVASNLAEDQGDRAQARAYVERALAVFGKTPPYLRQRGHALKALGRLERRAGRLDAARNVYQEALAIARSCNDRTLEAHLYNNLGIIAHCSLELDEAIRCYQHSIALTRETGATGLSGRRLGNLGQAYLSLGQIPEAVNALENAISWAREYRDRIGLADCLPYAALARLAMGQLGQAVAMAEEGLAIAREVANPYYIGHSLCALGECLLTARADLPRAIKLGHEAREIGRNSSLPDVVLRGLILCARSYAATGEDAAARGEAAAALRVSSQGGPELQWIIDAHLCYYDLVLPHSPDDALEVLEKARAMVERLAFRIRNEQLRAAFLSAPPQRDVLQRAQNAPGRKRAGNRQ